MCKTFLLTSSTLPQTALKHSSSSSPFSTTLPGDHTTPKMCDVETLQSELAVAHQRIEQLEARCLLLPMLFRVQSEEKRLRSELVYQWVKHTSDVAKGAEHLRSAVKLDKEERARVEWGHRVSPGRPILPSTHGDLDAMRTELYAALSQRASRIHEILSMEPMDEDDVRYERALFDNMQAQDDHDAARQEYDSFVQA